MFIVDFGRNFEVNASICECVCWTFLTCQYRGLHDLLSYIGRRTLAGKLN